MNPTIGIVLLVAIVLLAVITYFASVPSTKQEVVKRVAEVKKPAAKKTIKAKTTKKAVTNAEKKAAVKRFKKDGTVKNSNGTTSKLELVNNKPAFVAQKPSKVSKVDELRKKAKEKGIKGYSSMNIAQLTAALNPAPVEVLPAAKPAAPKTDKPKAAQIPSKKQELEKAEDKVVIIDQVVAEIMKPAEPNQAETKAAETTPTTTPSQDKKPE
jgi:hypothetical protein